MICVCVCVCVQENALSVLGEQFSRSWGEGGQSGAQVSQSVKPASPI